MALIYDTSATQGGNVFTSLDDLQAAILDQPFGPKAIGFRQNETIDQPLDLNGGTLVNLDRGVDQLITFEDGAELTNMATDLAYYRLWLYSRSTSPIITIGNDELVIDAGVTLSAKQAPFISMEPATDENAILSVRNSNLVKPSDQSIAGGDYECIEEAGTGGTSIIATVVGRSYFTEDVLRGTFIVYSRSTSASAVIPTQSNLGTLYVVNSHIQSVPRSVTTTTTARGGEVLLADTTGAGFTVTLPAAAGVTGQEVCVKKVSADGNTLTVDGDGAETIDGAATWTTSTQWASVRLLSTGTEWVIL